MTQPSLPDPPPIPSGDHPPDGGEVRSFLKQAVGFTLVGLAIYLALYAGSEAIARAHAERNRFHVVHTAPHARYDAVILGASRAAVFDYRDMSHRLEELSGLRVLNLATVGGGVTVNRFLLDYFLESRETGSVVYFMDSFAFYSPEWNEERLSDPGLYRRAPLDPLLVRRLLGTAGVRRTGLEYLSGFQKVNNPDRFEPDLFAAEGSAFERSYRPVPQIDRQRMEFLYPGETGIEALQALGYLEAFEAWISELRDRGVRVILVRPPLPDRILAMLPDEAAFEGEVRAMATRVGVEYHDLTGFVNDPEYFYDSDHLNRDGVLRFMEEHLVPILQGDAAL